MGIIDERRAEALLERALLQWLEEGYLPSDEELNEAYNKEIAKHGAATRSAVRECTLPLRWGRSSAGAFNQVLGASEEDLDIILRSLADLNELSIRQLTEWDARASCLDTRVRRLRSRIESLLLMKSEAAGYLAFVEDNFLSLENVSSSTTARIDTTTGEVTLNINPESGTGAGHGTQIDIHSSATVSFSLIERGNTRYFVETPGSRMRDVLDAGRTRWGGVARTKPPGEFRTAASSGKPIIGEVRVDLGREQKLSRIVLRMSEATAGSSSVVAIQCSKDAYVWENIPSSSFVQSGTGNFVFRFPEKEMRFFKIFISKACPDTMDERGGAYKFGVREIKVFFETFEVSADGVDLVTEVRTPKLGDTGIDFGRASLEVCEELPEGTSITYYLRGYDGASYTDWVQVSPLNRGNLSLAVVDFSAPQKLDSSSLLTSFDLTVDVEGLNIHRKDGATALDYRFNSPDETVANFYIPLGNELFAEPILLRNMGYTAGKFPTLETDLLVGDIPCGWGLEGESDYFCDFLVRNPAGMDLDFGETQATIDGLVRSGSVHIANGWHSFRTRRSNWFSLSSGTPPTDKREFIELDPLYPYNHKYLIEGYPYPSGFSGARPYAGVDLYGERRATRIGLNLLEEYGVDNSIYAIDTIDGPKSLIIVKFDPGRTTSQNERVRLFYSRRFEDYEGIQLKATLKTQDEQVTPTLTYYRIRVM